MKKVSLVLGSGGARGITQIGVIQYLESLGLEIDEVVGCSIGSLVGAAYSAGKVNELGGWMSKLTKMSVFNLMDFSDPRFGFLKGIKVMDTLREVFDDINIEDLPITYCAIATDLVSEKEAVFRTGSIYSAIRASIAIPAVFKGVEFNDSFLVDGGVLNPLPVNHVTHGDNIIIAVNLDGIPSSQATRNFGKMNAIDILQESYRVMRRRLSKLSIELHKPDFIIDIPHDTCGVWDFNQSSKLIEFGHEAALKTVTKENLQSYIPRIC